MGQHKYATTGPPFNFLGNLSETQKDAFSNWVNKQKGSLPDDQVFHQIRAQQLRKSAAMLEAFYAKAEPRLTPTFVKESWKPGPDWFGYGYRNDHLPAMTVSNVKDQFRMRLVTMDDAVFHMNHLRCAIERSEDLAQYANEAVKGVPDLMSRLDNLFGQAEYDVALVKDKSDRYKGEPRFRVHQLDDPTPWERETRTGWSPTTA